MSSNVSSVNTAYSQPAPQLSPPRSRLIQETQHQPLPIKPPPEMPPEPTHRVEVQQTSDTPAPIGSTVSVMA